MGELVVVLNGLEFRTRHNDYKLVQSNTIEPGASKIPYGAVTNIPFPEVPKAVTEKETVKEQVRGKTYIIICFTPDSRMAQA